jgi:hypothetical protein
LYPDQDLGGLLRTLAVGQREGWLAPDRLMVRFVGRLTDRAALEADRYGVAEFVSTSDPIPRLELIARMMSADALLLPVYDVQPSGLPMRLFEYIGAGRPILVLGNERHLVAQLVASHGLGRVLADSRDLQALLRTLVEDRNALPEPDKSGRDHFTWDETIHTLASLVAAV